MGRQPPGHQMARTSLNDIESRIRGELKTIPRRIFGWWMSEMATGSNLVWYHSRGKIQTPLLLCWTFSLWKKPSYISLTMLARRSLLAARTLANPLRQLTLSLPARALSTATAPLSQSTSTTTTQYPQPGAAEAEFELASRREKWYHVMRTRQGELPVYAKYRNDGGCKTIVRKIEVSFL